MKTYKAISLEQWDYFIDAETEEEARAMLEDEPYKYRNEFGGLRHLFIGEEKERLFDVEYKRTETRKYAVRATSRDHAKSKITQMYESELDRGHIIATTDFEIVGIEEVKDE